MKKIALIALAFLALQATAQEKRVDRPQKERKEMAQKFLNLSAEDMATLQTKKMTLHLDLNGSQQAKIHKLNLEHATAIKTKMQARKAAKESGTAQKPSDEDRFKMMNTMLDRQIATKQKMKDILNAEQYEKWGKSQMRMAQKHKSSKKYQNAKKNKGMKKQG
jgi:protein CpxP